MGRQLRGCFAKVAIGCVALLLLGGGAIAVLVVSSVRPFESAVDSREELETRFGDRQSYVPAADGAVSPDRVAAFVAVRRELFETCEPFKDTSDALTAMERFEGEAQPETTAVLKQAWKSTRASLRLGPMIGELFAVRNRALLEHGMGLGEYTYIYAMAYHDRLSSPSDDAGFLGDVGLDSRVLAVLRGDLEQQREAAEAEGRPRELLDGLAAEIGEMQDHRHRLPWAEGLPISVAASFDHARDELDALFCPTTTPLELIQNRREKFGYTSE